MHRGLILAAAGLLIGVQAHADEPDRGRGRLRVRLHGQQWPEPRSSREMRLQHRRDRLDHPLPGIRGGRDRVRMRQVRGGGEKIDLFRDTAVAKDAVDRLRRARSKPSCAASERVAYLADQLVAPAFQLVASGQASGWGLPRLVGYSMRLPAFISLTPQTVRRSYRGCGACAVAKAVARRRHSLRHLQGFDKKATVGNFLSTWGLSVIALPHTAVKVPLQRRSTVR